MENTFIYDDKSNKTAGDNTPATPLKYAIKKDDHSYGRYYLELEVDVSTKESLTSTLKSLIAMLHDEEFVQQTLYDYSPIWAFGYYDGEEFKRTWLFGEVSKYPELYPLVEQFFEQLRELNETEELLSDDMYLGTTELADLCVEDKRYIPLYIRFLGMIDLGNENGQDDEIADIAEKWGWCAETIPLFAARYFSLCGQHGDENIVDLLESGGSDVLAEDAALTDLFLKAIAAEYESYIDTESIETLFAAAFPDQPDHQEMAEQMVDLIKKGETPTMKLLRAE
jgi:hypothetical protein